MNKALFSSKTDQWATPQDFFDSLDAEFHFDLDPCADETNHKTPEYFTKEDDGLSKDWSGRRVFCNPPYGRAIGAWVEKAFREGTKDGTIVVLLIPARTDTKYFHDFILNRSEIRFVSGRLRFGGGCRKVRRSRQWSYFSGARECEGGRMNISDREKQKQAIRIEIERLKQAIRRLINIFRKGGADI